MSNCPCWKFWSQTLQHAKIVLHLFSEEVFDFSQGIMTQAKVKHLKDTMCNEFSEVFSLCNLVLDNSTSVPLVQATLHTLLGKVNIPSFLCCNEPCDLKMV